MFSNNSKHFSYFQETPEEEEEACRPPAPSKLRKMLYMCKVKGCDHAPFTNKHSLATHVIVTHKKEGSKCHINGKMMSKYHFPQHFDHHNLNKRFQCKQKLPGGDVCGRSYKQKSALIRCLREKHHIMSIESAHVKITSGQKVGYETAWDFEVEEEELELRMEQVNALVRDFGEIICE